MQHHPLRQREPRGVPVPPAGVDGHRNRRAVRARRDLDGVRLQYGQVEARLLPQLSPDRLLQRPVLRFPAAAQERPGARLPDQARQMVAQVHQIPAGVVADERRGVHRLGGRGAGYGGLGRARRLVGHGATVAPGGRRGGGFGGGSARRVTGGTAPARTCGLGRRGQPHRETVEESSICPFRVVVEDRNDPPVPRPRPALADASARAGSAHPRTEPAARAAGPRPGASRPGPGPDPAAPAPGPDPVPDPEPQPEPAGS